MHEKTIINLTKMLKRKYFDENVTFVFYYTSQKIYHFSEICVQRRKSKTFNIILMLLLFSLYILVRFPGEFKDVLNIKRKCYSFSKAYFCGGWNQRVHKRDLK